MILQAIFPFQIRMKSQLFLYMKNSKYILTRVKPLLLVKIHISKWKVVRVQKIKFYLGKHQNKTVERIWIIKNTNSFEFHKCLCVPVSSFGSNCQAFISWLKSFLQNIYLMPSFASVIFPSFTGLSKQSMAVQELVHWMHTKSIFHEDEGFLVHSWGSWFQSLFPLLVSMLKAHISC